MSVSATLCSLRVWRRLKELIKLRLKKHCGSRYIWLPVIYNFHSILSMLSLGLLSYKNVQQIIPTLHIFFAKSYLYYDNVNISVSYSVSILCKQELRNSNTWLEINQISQPLLKRFQETLTLFSEPARAK